MKTLSYSLLAFILLYGSFQYGRTYDDKRVILNQHQDNHIVLSDYCEVHTDSLYNVEVIWYQDLPYTFDPAVLFNP